MVRGIVLFIVSLVAVVPAQAKTRIAECSDIKGTQTYYFTQKPPSDSEYKLGKFYDISSGLEDHTLLVIWNENRNEALVNFVVRHEINNQEEPSKFILVQNDTYPGSEQVTFFGEFKGAPVLLSIYPTMNVGIFTQHSTWRAFIKGSNTSMYHMKCRIEDGA